MTELGFAEERGREIKNFRPLSVGRISDILKIRPWPKSRGRFRFGGFVSARPRLYFRIAGRRAHPGSSTRMSNRPTPAEAMALYHSLERPSGYKVAARFTAAGRPITARSISRWKKQGW